MLSWGRAVAFSLFIYPTECQEAQPSGSAALYVCISRCLFAANKRINQRTEDIWQNCLCTILHFECRIAQNWWHHFLLTYTVYIVCTQRTQQHDDTQSIFLECFHMRGRKCYLSTKHFHQISGKFQMLVNHLLFSVSETLMCGAGFWVEWSLTVQLLTGTTHHLCCLCN